jgi:membrane protease YdiL (CAAX protease family)
MADRRWTFAGLSLALVGPGAIAWVFRGELGSLPAGLAGSAALLALAIGVVAVARYKEGLPLASLGLRAVRVSTFAWAGVLLAAHVLVLTPLSQLVLSRIGDRGFGPNIEAFRVLPVWYRVAVVVVVPTIEELLYRGYAIDRLSALMNSRALAVLVSSIAFALVHAPTWGARDQPRAAPARDRDGRVLRVAA